jgi:hypothetical protein
MPDQHAEGGKRRLEGVPISMPMGAKGGSGRLEIALFLGSNRFFCQPGG